jgi:hypothetical protein
VTLKQRTELVRSDASSRQDSSQRGLQDVAPSVNRHSDGRPVGMLHDVVAARDPGNFISCALQGLDYLCSRYGRDSAGRLWAADEPQAPEQPRTAALAPCTSGLGDAIPPAWEDMREEGIHGRSSAGAARDRQQAR